MTVGLRKSYAVGSLTRIAALAAITLRPAHAHIVHSYIDPGNGMLLLQVIGAFFIGLVYQARKFFIRLRNKK